MSQIGEGAKYSSPDVGWKIGYRGLKGDDERTLVSDPFARNLCRKELEEGFMAKAPEGYWHVLGLASGFKSPMKSGFKNHLLKESKVTIHEWIADTRENMDTEIGT